MPIDDWLKTVESKWSILLQGSTWIMVLLAGFVLEPPVWDFQQNLIWYRFAHFVVAVVVGLAFIPVTRWSTSRDTWRWFIVSVVLLVAGVGSFFGYQTARETWTVEYAKKLVIVGSTYTIDALAYKERVKMEENREVSDKDLVMDAAGNREKLWDVQEIRARGRILGGLYILTVALFALTIISVIQAVYCNLQTDHVRPRARRRNTKAKTTASP